MYRDPAHARIANHIAPTVVTGWEIVLVATVMFLGSIIYSTFGFGMGLIAVPFLLLVDARLVPGSFLVASIAVSTPQVYGARHDVEWRPLVSMTIGRLPGSALAGVLLATSSDSTLAVLAAVSILVAVAMSLVGIRVPNTRPAHIGAGFMSGMAGTIAGVGGPPAVLALQHLELVRLRATMLWISLSVFAVSIPLVVIAGRLGRWELLAGLAIIVPVTAGMIVSRRVRPMIRHPDAGRWAVWSLSTFGSIGVLARELLL